MKLKKPLASFRLQDWLRVFLLTILLFIFFIFYNNSNFVISGEEKVLTKIDVLHEMILPGKFKPPYNFIFINAGKDLELVKDENGGDNAITNRETLASFIKIIADSNRHQFLLCDIIFDLPSPADSVFQNSIASLRRAVFPKHRGDTGITASLFSLPLSIADYNTNTGKFNKFRLIYNDTGKTIPVTLHEQLQKVNYTYRYGNIFCNNRFCLQTISPRYYIRPYQLTESKEYPYFNLGELMLLSDDPSFYHRFLENKFIVIGNFDTDVHDTPMGKMSGPLILLNTYLSLLSGRHQLTVWWFITLFIIFFVINLYLVYGATASQSVTKKEDRRAYIINSIWIKLFSLAGLCLGIAVISELVFGIQCQVLSVFAFIVVMNFLLGLFKIK